MKKKLVWLWLMVEMDITRKGKGKPYQRVAVGGSKLNHAVRRKKETFVKGAS